MTRKHPSLRLQEIRGQLARLVATPRDTVVMFDIRYEGLRTLEANLTRECDEPRVSQVSAA
jgi:hypothetical protein